MNEWTSVRLDEAVDRLAIKNTAGHDRVMTVSAQRGLVAQEKFFTKRVASTDLSGYWVIEPGDFVYNKSTSKDAPWGVIARYDGNQPAVVTSLYFVFRVKHGVAEPEFLRLALNSAGFFDTLRGMLREGARSHGLLNVRLAEFYGAQVILPSLTEQRRIVDVMAAVDAQIEALAAEVDRVGQVVLSVAEEAWSGDVTTSLAEHFEVIDCEHKTAPPVGPGEDVAGHSIGTKDLRAGQVLLGGAKPVSSSTLAEWTARTAPRENDLIFSREAPVGQVGRVGQLTGPVCLGQRTVLLRPKTDYPSEALWALIMAPSGQHWLREHSMGLTVQRVNVSTIKKFPLPGRVEDWVAGAVAATIQTREELNDELTRLRMFRSGLLTSLLNQDIEIPDSYDDLLEAAS